ncbi:hypothetical protein RI054_06g32630 [Pseudoscourfieldia marina]
MSSSLLPSAPLFIPQSVLAQRAVLAATTQGAAGSGSGAQRRRRNRGGGASADGVGDSPSVQGDGARSGPATSGTEAPAAQARRRNRGGNRGGGASADGVDASPSVQGDGARSGPATSGTEAPTTAQARRRNRGGNRGGGASADGVDASPSVQGDGARSGPATSGTEAPTTAQARRRNRGGNRGGGASADGVDASPSVQGDGARSGPATSGTEAPTTAQARRRNRGGNRGGGASADGEAPTPAPAAAAKAQRRRRGDASADGEVPANAATTKAQRRKWWHSLPDDVTDCITFEAIRDLRYPPFELQPQIGKSLEDVHSNSLFDPKSLSKYFLTTTQFVHPFSRREVTLEEVRRLDAHLDRHKLRDRNDPTRLEETFAHPEERLRELEGRAISQERGVINQHMMRVFGGNGIGGEPIERGARRSQRGDVRLRHVDDTTHADGPRQLGQDTSWRLVDDGMQGEWATLGVPEPQAQMIRNANAFPSLGNWVGHRTSNVPPPPPDAFPALETETASQPRPVTATAAVWGANSSGSTRPPASVVAAASREEPPPPPPRPARSMMRLGQVPASSTVGQAAATPPQIELSEEEEAALARRRQLAEAFGIADPDNRPSSFAASSATQFSSDVLALARRNPDFVRLVESQLQQFVLSASAPNVARRPMRHSLPSSACRMHRKLCHEVAESFGLTTHSFGSGADRHVDCFYNSNSGVPSTRLSDAMLVEPSALEESDASTQGAAVEKFEMRFCDVENVRGLRGMLREWEVALNPVDGRTSDRYVALFSTERDLEQAQSRFGAGVRGIFRVEHASPAPPPPPPPTTTTTTPVRDERERPLQEVPEGIDPSFLDALPPEMRAEVIAQHLASGSAL